MSFDERIQSVSNERQGGRASILRTETGRGIREWDRYIRERLFPVMYPAQGGSSRFPRNVVSDAVYVSAIYEWAARSFCEDLTDRFSHSRNGPQLDSDPGAGASIGWFQGYACMAYQALRANPRLIDLLAGERDPGAQAVVAASRSRVRVAVPTMTVPRRPQTVSGADSALRSVLSEFENLRGPLVSLIGKAQLTLRCVREVDARLGERVRSLPASVMRWVVLCYESGGFGWYLRRLIEVYDPAPPGSPVSIEGFGPGNRGRLRTTFRALGIDFAEIFTKPARPPT